MPGGARVGHVTSEETRQKIAEAHTMHGHRIAPKGSPEFRTWSSWAQMRRRCLCETDAAYSSYGGRGILICPRWKLYKNFLEDMGLRPEGMSIDRIDNNSHYEPENCKWSTKLEQARNRRSSRLLLIEGVERTLAEWSEMTGLRSSTIRMRVKYNGGRIDKSILEPVTEK